MNANPEGLRAMPALTETLAKCEENMLLDLAEACVGLSDNALAQYARAKAERHPNALAALRASQLLAALADEVLLERTLRRAREKLTLDRLEADLCQDES